MSLDLEEPNAQFNPHLISSATAAEPLELACIESGIPITDLSDQNRRKHKLYMDCREHFNDDQIVIGYCSGIKTPFLFVEWKIDGGFHGRPMCIVELKKNGAKL